MPTKSGWGAHAHDASFSMKLSKKKRHVQAPLLTFPPSSYTTEHKTLWLFVCVSMCIMDMDMFTVFVFVNCGILFWFIAQVVKTS